MESAPPIEPFDRDADAVYGEHESPPAWPTVLGIISIVLGGLGILFNLCGAISSLFMDAMQSTFLKGPLPEDLPDQARDAHRQMMEMMQGVSGYQAVMAVLMLALAVLLLIAGIMMLQRKARSVMLSFYWSWMKIIAVIGSAALQAWIFSQQQEFMQQMMQSMPNGESMPPEIETFMGSFFAIVSVFSVIFILLIGWAYPIFLLVWLSRPGVKRHYQQWNELTPTPSRGLYV